MLSRASHFPWRSGGSHCASCSGEGRHNQASSLWWGDRGCISTSLATARPGVVTKHKSRVDLSLFHCSSLQGADLWFPSSILFILSLITGHLITLLNPEPKRDGLWETDKQWKELIYHQHWGLERCLLHSTDGSATRGLPREYPIGRGRTGLHISGYNWCCQVCP